jgi:TPR repeat protein
VTARLALVIAVAACGKDGAPRARDAAPAAPTVDTRLRDQAEHHLRGYPPQFDPPRAQALYEQACDAGDLGACVTLGPLLRDPAAATPLYQRACDGGFGAGCEALARRGDDALFARAVALYRRQCDAEPPTYCSALGWLLANGTGAPRSLDEARAAFRRGCVGGDQAACADVAFFDVLRGSPAGPQLDRLDRLCSAGVGYACSLLGGLVAVGEHGIPRDDARARDLLYQSCVLGDGEACESYAAHADDPAVADRACVLGRDRACAALGYPPTR